MRFFTRRGWTLLLTAAVIIGAISISYGADRPLELVGDWILLKGYNKSSHWTDGVNTNFPQTGITLYADGTGVWDGNDRGLRWKTENNRITFQRGYLDMTAGYNVSGYELILTYEVNESMYGSNLVKKNALFVKKDKLAEYRKMKDQEEELKNKKEPIYFTDPRDGQTYRTVKIGGKTWMAQNLNYWPKPGKSNCYDKNISNCAKYGRLYDWKTAKTACPAGWSLPTDKDLGKLIGAAGGWDDAGRRLKAKSGWNDDNGKSGNGVDVYGFSALPGGAAGGKNFYDAGNEGYWWVLPVDEEGNLSEYSFNILNILQNGTINVISSESDYFICGGANDIGRSIRCVQD